MEEDYPFEWDDKKHATNLKLKRLGFDHVEKMWRDPNKVYAKAKDKLLEDGNIENRMALVAKLDDKIWVCIYTIRNNKRRIISFRRASEKFVRMYHGKK